MAETATSTTQVDSIDDIFADPTEAELSSSVEQPPTSGDGSQGSPDPVNEFEGLPFQDFAALKEGYKNLQRSYTQERIGSLEMAKRLKELEAATKATTPTTKAEAAEKQDTLARIKALLEDPDAVLDQRIKPLETRLNELSKDNLALKREKELNSFYKDVEDAGFGKLTDEDEQELLLIIRQSPWLASAPLTHQLTTALNALLRREPTRFTSRSTAPKDSKDLTAAKRAAGVAPKGGSKASAGAKDEFDDVLDLDRAEKAKW